MIISLFFSSIGRTSIAFFDAIGSLALFIQNLTIIACTKPLKRKKMIAAMETIGVASLPIVILCATFTGMVFALQSYIGFSRIGGEQFIGLVVSMGMVRELGPVLTALMVAGRAGSAIAAELGTMKVTEQIDALVTLGIDPYHFLIVPRMLAGFIILPIITMIAMICGMAGGFVVSIYVLGLSSDDYISSIIRVLSFSDILSGLIKAACFGFIIALAGCYQGIKAQGGARGVGQATTQGVVFGSVFILISNYILTQLFEALNI